MLSSKTKPVPCPLSLRRKRLCASAAYEDSGWIAALSAHREARRTRCLDPALCAAVARAVCLTSRGLSGEVVVELRQAGRFLVLGDFV